jgi:hypothetical protein
MFFTSRRAAGAIVALGFAVSATSAQAALTAVGATDPATKAPAFYTDANGLSLALCHPGTANCGPAAPGEDFYNFVTSTITMPNGGTASLTLNVTLAPNVTNDPSAFNRVRIQLDGAPAGTYTITHPYGTDTVDVPSAGARGRTTIDIGCLVAASGPCNFASAMAGRYGPFLTPAPGGFAPPAGFIGDFATLTPVIGSPLGTNFFRVEGPRLPAGGIQSNTFALMGKLFGGVVPAFASTGSGAFADQLVSSASAVKNVTVNSAGIPGAGSNLTIGGVTVTGANAADFAIASNTCAGANLASGSSCNVGVTFTPSASGARSAALTIADNTAAGTHTIALSGNGTTPAPAPAVASPAPAVVTPKPVIVAPVLTVVTPAKPMRIRALLVASKVKLRQARHGGVLVRFTAPAGANVARLRLLNAVNLKPVATKLVALIAPGRRAIHVRARTARATGYVLDVAVGASAASLGPASSTALKLAR